MPLDLGRWSCSRAERSYRPWRPNSDGQKGSDARYSAYHWGSVQCPQSSTGAVRQGTGLLDRSRRGRLVVEGSDRIDYLQGLLTNDVTALGPGDGCYAAYLTAQGRLTADLDLFNLGNAVLIDVHGDVKSLLVERFRELVFTEEIEIDDWTDTWTSFGLHGPTAPDVLEGALAQSIDAAERAAMQRLNRYQCLRLSIPAGPVIVARTDELGEPGFSLFVERGGMADLAGALVAAGGLEIDQRTNEIVRVESGRPAFPEDMDQKMIPLEAGIEGRAISDSKGCYVGQEVIIRILHRGQGRVAKRLVGLTLGAAATDAIGDLRVPDRGAALLVGDEAVGRITSAVLSPTLAKVIALGYLPRALVEPGSQVSVALGEDRVEAVVTARPFVTTSLRDWRP